MAIAIAEPAQLADALLFPHQGQDARPIPRLGAPRPRRLVEVTHAQRGGQRKARVRVVGARLLRDVEPTCAEGVQEVARVEAADVAQDIPRSARAYPSKAT